MVELLVVIAIIGILSTLLLLQLNVARQKARDAKRVADINQVRSALELYYDDEGAYLVGNSAAALAGLDNYLTKIPSDPSRVATCEPLGYVGAAGAGGGGNACYGYAWDPATAPSRFHIWVELEQKAASALGNDLDLNSSAVGTDPENFAGGAVIDGANEPAAEAPCLSTVVDCVYDVGQPK